MKEERGRRRGEGWTEDEEGWTWDGPRVGDPEEVLN